MLAAERTLQERLAPLYFGPSIFLLLRKPQTVRPAPQPASRTLRHYQINPADLVSVNTIDPGNVVRIGNHL